MSFFPKDMIPDTALLNINPVTEPEKKPEKEPPVQEPMGQTIPPILILRHALPQTVLV